MHPNFLLFFWSILLHPDNLTLKTFQMLFVIGNVSCTENESNNDNMHLEDSQSTGFSLTPPKNDLEREIQPLNIKLPNAEKTI